MLMKHGSNLACALVVAFEQRGGRVIRLGISDKRKHHLAVSTGRGGWMTHSISFLAFLEFIDSYMRIERAGGVSVLDGAGVQPAWV